MNSIICEAIENKKLLSFIYKNEQRIVEPHLLGRKTSGRDALSAYLVGGYTESDRQPYWRNFTVEKMESITVLDESFTSARPGYNPNDQTMEQLYCHL